MKKLLSTATTALTMAYGVFAGGVQITMPQEGWIANNKPEGSVSLSFEKAPDQSDAVRIKFTGKKYADAIMPKEYVTKAAAAWPSVFKGFRGFVWNDGRNNTIRIRFCVAVNEGNMPKQLNFWSFLKVDHKGWKLMTCEATIDFQNKQAKLKPSDISSILFTLDQQPGAEIAIGALTWIAEGVELRRNNEGNSAPIFLTKNPPALDGDDNDEAWKNVPEMPLAFLKGTGVGSPENKTTVKVVYDAENLYLLADCPFKDRSRMKAEITAFDSELWLDEDMEIILYPEADPRKYCQFIVNPLGTRTDLAMIFDQVEDRICMKFKDWNPGWKAAVKIGKSSWKAELCIPWKAIGGDKPPALLQFQAARNDTTVGQCAMWSPTAGIPATGAGYLSLHETGGLPITVSGLAFQRNPENKFVFNCTATAEKEFKGLTVKTHFCAPRSAPDIFTKTFPAESKSAMIDFTVDSKKLLNGKYLAAVEFIPGNKELLPVCEAYYFNQTLPATVKFSDIVFNPVPKVLEWKNGAFTPAAGDTVSVEGNATERTVKTAAYLAKRMNGVYGIEPQVRKVPGGRLVMAVNKALVKSKTQSDSQEAYTLEVTPEKIVITGADEAGLYYGVVTLMQLMQGAKQPNTPVRALVIADWPTYTRRMVSTYEQFHLKKDNGGGSGGHQIGRYKEWIEKSVAGNKCNILLMGWADQINYVSVPEVHHENNFSPAEIKELFVFGREHFIDVSPAVLYGAHSDSWLRHFPHLKEAGWGNNQFDMTLPETYALMGKIFNELMDIAGDESHYFYIFNDEWWHGSRTSENYMYKGKSRQELLYECLMAEYRLAGKRGKKMVMCTDMINPKHNGGPPWNLSEVADRLPKDIVMATWSESNDFFAGKGFKETWVLSNGFSGDSKKPSLVDSGYGHNAYLLSQTLFDQTDQKRNLTYCFLNTFPSANYAWNKEEKGVLPGEDWTLQNLPAYIGSFSFKPNPAAGSVLTAYDVPKTAGIAEQNEIQKITAVGEIAVKPGAAFALPKAKVEIVLPSGSMASSFYVLGAVYPADKEAISKLQKAYRAIPSSSPYGLIMGKYRIVYVDGTFAETEIRLGRSMGLFQYTPAQSRYCYEVRAVYPLTAEQEKGLTQFEMINPNPGKEIKSFEVTGNFDYAPVLLCGLTGRSVR